MSKSKVEIHRTTISIPKELKTIIDEFLEKDIKRRNLNQFITDVLIDSEELKPLLVKREKEKKSN